VDLLPDAQAPRTRRATSMLVSHEDSFLSHVASWCWACCWQCAAASLWDAQDGDSLHTGTCSEPAAPPLCRCSSRRRTWRSRWSMRRAATCSSTSAATSRTAACWSRRRAGSSSSSSSASTTATTRWAAALGLSCWESPFPLRRGVVWLLPGEGGFPYWHVGRRSDCRGRRVFRTSWAGGTIQ